MEEIFYSIVDEETGDCTGKVHIAYDAVKDTTEIVFDNGVNDVQLTIGNQQLAELSVLLLAIAGPNVDFSSCDSVLEGFSLKCRPQIESLLKEIAE